MPFDIFLSLFVDPSQAVLLELHVDPISSSFVPMTCCCQMFVNGPVSSNEPYLLVPWLSVERFVSCVATGELSRIMGLGSWFWFCFRYGIG